MSQKSGYVWCNNAEYSVLMEGIFNICCHLKFTCIYFLKKVIQYVVYNLFPRMCIWSYKKLFPVHPLKYIWVNILYNRHTNYYIKYLLRGSDVRTYLCDVLLLLIFSFRILHFSVSDKRLPFVNISISAFKLWSSKWEYIPMQITLQCIVWRSILP